MITEKNENVKIIASAQKKRRRSISDDAGRSAAGTTEQSLAHEEFTVGWICALSVEYVAAQVFLDEKYQSPEYVHPSDDNDYTLGKIGRHNVVIAVLPKGEYGISSATGVAKNMLHSFPNIRIGLMVGIGGGAPSQRHDIRLGDVVVSAPCDGTGGVFQYDFGKAIQDGTFHTTGFLNQPPRILRTAVNGLEADYEIHGHKLEEAINNVLDKLPRLRRKYGRPLPTSDILYQSSVIHPLDIEENCASRCGDISSNIVVRLDRTEEDDNPAIHYGLIASANQVMKDALIRDKLIKEKDVLCFEMEAAGLMNQFSCLVIRGICDYSDSHKNKEWQGYAAMTAAAYTKDLLSRISPSKVETENRIADILQNVHEDVEELLRVHYDQKHQEILNWLTPIDFAPQQSDYIRIRQPGTCHWFLASDKYLSFIKSDKQTLFCPGAPGAGKTIMSAAVIDDLLYTQYKDDASVGIAYLYCDFRRHYEQKTQDLVESLLKQLVQKQTTIPECVQALYKECRKELRRPSLDEVSEALRTVSSIYSKVFILIDALDECQDTGGCRKNFLSRIFKLQTERNINIFATSRYIQDIVDAFHQSICFDISAKDEDVQAYLDNHMARLPPFVLRSPDLQNEIKAKICQRSNGMFLLVRLHIDSLAQMPTVGHIRQALRNLPRSLSKIYEQSIERIENQGEFLHQLARKVIIWLIHAKRVLSTTELRHAVAVQPGTLELDEEFIPDRETLASICAGLVTYDAESNVLRLAHYTIQEHFEGEGRSWVQDAETELATACVTYLSFRAFESGICRTNLEHEERKASNPLYNYASKHWGLHALTSIETQPILDFLNSEVKVSAATQELVRDNITFFQGINVGYGTIGIHLAAYFGLENMATNLLENGHDPNARSWDENTPLFWAIRGGHQGMVKQLYNYGAHINVCNGMGRTPLSEAVSCANEDITKWLLGIGAEIEAIGQRGGTPLHWASEMGCVNIAKALLENGAEINAIDEFGQTPLFCIYRDEVEDIARLLLEHGADANAADEDGKTVLMQVADTVEDQEARFNVTKLLLKHEADVNAADEGGKTALMVAINPAGNKKSNIDIIKLLLEHGADINAADRYGKTALMVAANLVEDLGGDNSIAKFLLEHGADVNAADKDGNTALMAAVDYLEDGKININIVKPLLEHGADVNATTKKGRTALMDATFPDADGANIDIMKLLLEHGADINAADKDGLTVLIVATYPGLFVEEATINTIKFLLENGAEINAADKDGQTALIWGAKFEYEEDEDIFGRYTCRERLITQANITIIKFLLENGAEVDAADESGQTPLIWAAKTGNEDVIKLLLENGAGIDVSDKNGLTALYWANSKEQREIVKLLLERGADAKGICVI
ncbi:ankyrin repeat-containing domain protein [Trichoderma evansii]